MKEESTDTIIATGPGYDIVVEKRARPVGAYPKKLLKLSHQGTAILVAENSGRLILVSQFRPILNKRTLEFPGGIIRKGESPKAAAEREFTEEAGLTPSNIQYLGSFIASIGTSDERIYHYSGVCESLPIGLQALDAFSIDDKDPEIKVLSCEENELNDLLRDGMLDDGKTALAYLLWRRFIRGLDE